MLIHHKFLMFEWCWIDDYSDVWWLYNKWQELYLYAKPIAMLLDKTKLTSRVLPSQCTTALPGATNCSYSEAETWRRCQVLARLADCLDMLKSSRSAGGSADRRTALTTAVSCGCHGWDSMCRMSKMEQELRSSEWLWVPVRMWNWLSRIAQIIVPSGYNQDSYR